MPTDQHDGRIFSLEVLLVPGNPSLCQVDKLASTQGERVKRDITGSIPRSPQLHDHQDKHRMLAGRRG